jgi:hypothetical protein
MGLLLASYGHSGSARRRAGGLGGASQRDRDTSRAGVVPAARNDLPRGPRADCHVRGCAECDCGRGGRRRWLHSASSICPTRRPTMAALCAASVVLTVPHPPGRYIVASGRVLIETAARLALLCEGDHFGEAGLIFARARARRRSLSWLNRAGGCIPGGSALTTCAALLSQASRMRGR